MKGEAMTAQSGAPIASAVRVLQVCEALSEHQPIGVRELARLMEIPSSSVQRALDTLLAAGWAIRPDGGGWALSSRCAVVGARAGTGGVLRELARSAMSRLSRITDESVRLWIREGDHVALLESLDSRQLVRYVSPPTGSTLPLHASASGKAILAYLPAAELDDLLGLPLEAVTTHTITDPDRLRAALDRVRQLGYSETFHEARDDIGGVAAPIVDANGRPVAALSLALPMHRLTEDLVRTYGAHVRDEASTLSDLFAGRSASAPNR